MFDVVTLGEILIDFTPVEVNKQILLEKNPGGAPANVAVGVSRLGLKAAFIGKVGDDGFGYFLKDTLEKNNVDTKGLVIDKYYNTTLAFVELDEKGDRNFTFVRKNGADTKLKPSEINREIIANTKIFHFGSLSMTDEPSLSATIKAIKSTRGLISFDPNLRPPLWKDLKLARERILRIMKYVNILKVSEEELYFLTNINNIEKATDLLRQEFKTRIILVTLGENGCFYSIENERGYVKSPRVKAVDTTGAGDSFLAGFLYYFISNENLKMEEALKFANTVAAITVTKRGAIPALPDLKEVIEFKNKVPS
ncbi:MAG: carbohydrate kinase [Brevinematales bacterium]|nr:carbohydrate kinase [Brevinematales bacterium]